MTHNEQRKLALNVLDEITDWKEYVAVTAAYAAVGIFTEFEAFMFAWDKREELKEKGLI